MRCRGTVPRFVATAWKKVKGPAVAGSNSIAGGKTGTFNGLLVTAAEIPSHRVG
jgi:hypothetical protein